jgi:Protein of unknown function (DUF416)
VPMDRLVGHWRNPPEPPRPPDPVAAYDAVERDAVGRLGSRQQLAFAVACAERQYPAYAAFAGPSGTEPDGLVRRALDAAWDGVLRGRVDEPDPAGLAERCVELIPDQDASRSIPPLADDAIAAAAYAVQAAAGLDERAPGWAAAHGLDTLEELLLPGVIDHRAPDAVAQLWAHPWMRSEIERRRADLEDLGADDWLARLEAVHARAMGASLLPIDQLPPDELAP